MVTGSTTLLLAAYGAVPDRVIVDDWYEIHGAADVSTAIELILAGVTGVLSNWILPSSTNSLNCCPAVTLIARRARTRLSWWERTCRPKESWGPEVPNILEPETTRVILRLVLNFGA